MQNTGQSVHLVPDSRVNAGVRTHLPDPQNQGMCHYLVKHLTASHRFLQKDPNPVQPCDFIPE